MSKHVPLRQGWMGYLQSQGQDPTLVQITIPGTHDSGTWAIGPSVSRCQTWTLEEQLNAGIRFIDIRLAPESDASHPDDLKIYHSGDDCHIWFSDVIATCRAFLRANRGETVIMSIKNEHFKSVTPEDFARALDPWLDAKDHRNADLFRVATTVPKLSEAKGRIVLVRRYAYPAANTPGFNPPQRYNNGAPGIDAVTGWPEDEMTTAPTSGSPQLMVQDVYSFDFTSRDEKWSRFVEPFLRQTESFNPNYCWFFNFTSASGGLPPSEFSIAVSTALQIWLEDKVNQGQAVRLGTVVMDFPSPRNVDLLILLNMARTNLVQAFRGYTLRLAGSQRGIAKAYRPGQWNYAQGNTHDLVPHAMAKIAGDPDIVHIYPGDEVMLQSTQFTNDADLYLEGIGYSETGWQLYYCSHEGWSFGSDMVRWQVESAEGSRSASEPFELGDTVRFRNLSTHAFAKAEGYLFSNSDNDYLGTSGLPDPNIVGDLMPEDFVWTIG